MTGTENILLQPVIQYGFLGFAAVLLGIIVWLIRRLLEVLDATNRIIAANTEAINDLTQLTSDLLILNRSMHDKLLSRPCIAGQQTVRPFDYSAIRSRQETQEQG